MSADAPWPADARFAYGEEVERADFPNGKPPAYRFPGRVCGWYRTPSENLGFAVSNIHEPACIQIFPQSGLRARA